MSLNPGDREMTPDTTDDDAPEAYFTVAELAQLRALRRHFQAHPEHRDAEAAMRRLEFARWLVQHGKLTDG